MFSDSLQQLKAYEPIIGIYLSEYMDRVVKHRAVSDTPFEKYKGLVVSLEEAENVFVPRSFSLSEEGKKLVADIYARVTEETRASEENGLLPLEHICEVFGFGMLERFIIVLAAMPMVNSEYEKTFGYINDNVRLTAPTAELALSLFAENNLSLLPRLESRLFRYVFEQSDGNPLSAPLKLREYFVSFLAYGRYRNSDFMKMGYPEQTGMVCHKKQLEEISAAVAAEGKRVICLEGEKGSGRKRLVLRFAAQDNRNVLFIDLKKYGRAERKNAERDVICELLLRQCHVCITEADDEPEQLRELLEVLFRAAKTVFVCARERVCADVPVLSVKLNELSREMRYELWQSTGLLSEELCLAAANKFRFSPGQISEAAKAIREQLNAHLCEEPNEEILSAVCCALTEHSMGDKAKLISSPFTLDDLILPDGEKQQIREACAHIRYRHIVYDKWDFESKLAYGKGLTMLFAGPPGTGKTMAAAIVARELGLPAYRVDISQIMSKYIGETEKSLGEIFDAAQRSNAILFFDETDAIFGKRSEIKDSRDRYANVETSFLLQRLESFDGIVLMSTNLLQNIDDAFMRRINYIISFPFPDAERRLELWKKMFPRKMPVDESVDFEYLARQFELSGAAIKSAVMSAAFLAAEEGACVNMSHILRAVKKQLMKQGKLLVESDFGKYAMFV